MAASKLRVLAIVLGSILCVHVEAFAQGRDPVAGEALFQQGKEALDRGDYEAACAKLDASLKADPAPGTLFFLAECEEKRGRVATAWARFKELEQKLPAEDTRRPTVIQRAAALEPRIPKLVIRLAPGTPPGAVISRDGVELGAGSIDAPLPVDPGKHTIVVEAKGHERSEATVDVTGTSAEITVGPGKRLPEAGPPTTAGTGGVQVPVGITIGSLGVAGMIGGIVAGAIAKSNYDDAEPHCDADDFCTQDGIDIRDDARTVATAGTIVFVVGAAVAATGLVVWLTAPKSEGGLVASAPRPSIGLGLAPTGLSIRGTW